MHHQKILILLKSVFLFIYSVI